MRIQIINGPNLNLLGKREPSIYGVNDFESYFLQLQQTFAAHSLSYFQSNIEGELINCIQGCLDMQDAIIINAGGYTHTSVAIGDALRAVSLPYIEVHVSNIYARESFRHVSMIGAHAKGVISGLGLASYQLAIQALLHE